MKIAIYHNLPSGGAKRELYEHVAGSRKLHEYHLFRLDDPRNEEYLDLRPLVESVRSFPLPNVTIPHYLKGFRAIEPLINLSRLDDLQRIIATQIDAGGFDVVFVEPCRYTQAPAILKYLSTPSLYFAHEPRRSSVEFAFRRTYPHVTGPVSGLRWLQQHVLEARERRIDETSALAATRLVCNSYYSVESLYRAYGREASVCYLGANLEMFDVVSDAPKDGSVLAVGALHPAKDPLLLIRSVALLPEATRPTVRLVYDRAMDGYDEVLKEEAKRLGVTLDLQFHISDHQLVRFYNQAEAVICSAHLEPFGFTPLEAMSCGTPVVAVKEGGFRETVIDGVNGYLVDRTPQAMAKAIGKVFDGHITTTPNQLRQSIEQNWNWPTSVGRLEQLLAETAV